MRYDDKTDRLRVLRQNMANKMVAGLDYSYEEDQISKILAQDKQTNG